MAQKNLTRLNVALTMTTGAFTRSTQSAISAASAMGERMKGAILGPIGMVTGALSTGAFVVAVRAAAQRIDELAKSADRLGVSTQSLAGFRYAAEQTGTSIELMEQSMAKLQVRIEQANSGNKQAAESFAALGLSVTSLAKLPADQQMAKVADSLNGMGSQAQRTSAAVAIFGEQGSKMAGMLALGSAGLQKATADAEKMGLALSRVDAAKVEESNLAMGRIAKVIEGAMNVAAVKLAPIMTIIADEMLRASNNTNGFGTVLDRVIGFGVGAVGLLANAIAGLKVTFLSVRAAGWSVSKVFVDGADLAVKAVQFVIQMYSKQWDFIKAGAEAVWAALKYGWAAAKVPIADFVQFAGGQIASLLRVLSEATMRFDVEAGTKILNAANSVQVSVGAMGATARREMEAAAGDVSQSTARAGAAWSAMFQDYSLTGSQAIQDLSATMQEVINEDLSAVEDMMNSSTPWQQLEDRVTYEQAAAQQRAEARAAEVEAARTHSGQMFEIEDKGLQQVRFGWLEHYDWLKASGSANTQQALNASSNFFGNLAALQQSHSKKARAIGDAAAKAKIVTDTASAAMAAYSSLAGIPLVGPALGAAAAAAAVAAGAVQLGNVGKNSIGGTSNMGAPGDAGSSMGPAASKPTQTLVLQGEMFSAESLMKIFDQAKEQGFQIEGIRRA